jgi:hypothetical protein
MNGSYVDPEIFYLSMKEGNKHLPDSKFVKSATLNLVPLEAATMTIEVYVTLPDDLDFL